MADMPAAHRSGFIKIAAIFIGIILFVFAAFVALRAYQLKQGQENVRKLAEAIQKAQDDERQMEMNDTYGGKTPQETLNMYIAAVEKGDYELASKYFVKEKQDEELNKFRNAKLTKSQVAEYLTELRNVLKNTGSYDDAKTYFSFNGPILVSFRKYLSGTWKIEEI